MVALEGVGRKSIQKKASKVAVVAQTKATGPNIHSSCKATQHLGHSMTGVGCNLRLIGIGYGYGCRCGVKAAPRRYMVDDPDDAAWC